MCSCKPHNTYIRHIFYMLHVFFLKKIDSSAAKLSLAIILNFLNLKFKLSYVVKSNSLPKKDEISVLYSLFKKKKKFILEDFNKNDHTLYSLYFYFFSSFFFLDKSYKNINNVYIYSYKNVKNKSKIQLFSFGLLSFFKKLIFWFLPLTILLIFSYYTFFLKSLPFTKILFSYFLYINMFYLLLSGFVFFIKKYQYRLYTTSVQRFWRRSLMVFWLIEVSLFVVFIYLTVNSSQEPIYVYDNAQLYKTHFYSWRFFICKIATSTALIICTFLLLLTVKWNTFSKANNIIFIITILLLYIFWLEFYQFMYVLCCYGNTDWVYDIYEHVWNLETEFRRTRIVNHYVTICLIAKFWHIVFAVIFWVFFILRNIESGRIRYIMLVSNLQNFIFIYIMSWIYMYPWFKFVFRKILDFQYYWFFLNNRKLGIFLFFNDMNLYKLGLIHLFKENFNFLFKKNAFYYLIESTYSTSIVGNNQFRKHSVRDLFLRVI